MLEEEAGARQGDSCGARGGGSLSRGRGWLWGQGGCNLVSPELLVGEAGPVGAVGAWVSRVGLFAQGRSGACWVPSLCRSRAVRDESNDRDAGCLLLVCGAPGKPHEIPSRA